MRRALAIVAVWLAAGSGAVMLSSAAVSMVGNRVTAGRPASLSTDQVRDQLNSSAGSTTVPRADGSGSEPSSEEATTTTRPAEDDTTGSTIRTTGTPTTQPKPSTEPVGSTTTTTQAVTVRTYALVGGTATLRFSPSGVTVQDATPKPGYSVEIEPQEGNGVQVTFESDAHRSRAKGWWENGPRDEVREESDSDS